jgi:hypothetical protein
LNFGFSSYPIHHADMSNNEEVREITNPGYYKPTIEARVDMINGYFPLPGGTVEAMKTVRAAADVFARALLQVSKEVSVVDTGRMIAAIDLIQQTKNVACDSLILPYAVKKV